MARVTDVLAKVQADKARWIALQYVDVPGFLHQVTVSASQVDAAAFSDGVAKLDGSSARGFQAPEDSDMVLVPDADSYSAIPWEQGTWRFLCDVRSPLEGPRYPKNPRYISQRAEDAVKAAGFARVHVGAELKYSLLDQVVTTPGQPERAQGFSVESREAAWNSLGTNFPIEFGKGRSVPAPQDMTGTIRSQACEVLEDAFSIPVHSHQHGASTAGQADIALGPLPLAKAADATLTAKYAIRNMAAVGGLLATFLPYPIYGENGNSLHAHLSAWKGENNMFYDEGDKQAELSNTGRYFVGGLLLPARALCSFACPTNNSYKRLLADANAPAWTGWGKGNRTALIRVPVGRLGNAAFKHAEFRASDPSANPHLLYAALAAAGLDGIKTKADPGDPIPDDIRRLDDKKRKEYGVKPLCTTLGEALAELQSDDKFLRNIFTSDILDAHIELKSLEEQENAKRPAPYEFQTYLQI
ncbi:Glutamine synthetase [uncultured archaeon]|nr:Glutamine synthetase [uncultured archaeon]